jgi:diguanylate cyclase (GGDEF)-like protein
MATGMISVYRNYLALLEDSQRDTLTGLLNRKTFDTGFAVFLSSAVHLDAELQDDRRSHKEGSHWLAVMDIDHFKRVNDTFGHLYGDEVLILMANLMRGSFRQGDRLYRFGGEEFVVLMRDVDFADVKKKLDDFREKVEQHVFPQVGQVTISIGFTSVMPTSTPAMVLGEADEALYYAKGHGRNQVRCYGELVEQKLLAEKTVHTEVDYF